MLHKSAGSWYILVVQIYIMLQRYHTFYGTFVDEPVLMKLRKMYC